METDSQIINPEFRMLKYKKESEDPRYLAYRQKWNYNPTHFKVDKFPLHLDFETTTSCNLRCPFCFQSYDPPQPQKLDFEIYTKVIDEGAANNLYSVKLQYRGEPTLDKRLPEFVAYAKESGILDVMFNTNATLLTENLIYKLIGSGLDKIICSVDGYTKKAYESIRIGAKFETVLENIRNFQRIKKELGIEKPVLRVQMVDTPVNHPQIGNYVNFWGGIADHVAIEDLEDYNIQEESYAFLPNFHCVQLWQRLLILADGDVLPCCRAIRGGTEKLETLGNIADASIKYIWNSKRMKTMRYLHESGVSHRIRMCRLCSLRRNIENKKKCIKSKKL